MIEINSLRIGNWVLHEGQPKQVVAIDSQAELPNLSLKGSVRLPDYIEDYVLGYTGRWVQQVNGVLLSPEVLAKCSEVKEHLQPRQNRCRDASGRYDGYCVALKYRFDIIYKSHIVSMHYLHEYQNFIFALTGKELIYTP